jgi:hypothetical protein
MNRFLSRNSSVLSKLLGRPPWKLISHKKKHKQKNTKGAYNCNILINKRKETANCARKNALFK